MTQRILITSYVFPPGVGGIERATLSLARMLSALGHRVTVVTREGDPWPAEAAEPYRVVRRPSPTTLLRLVRQADAVIVNNPSFNLQWPLALIRRPHVTVLHAALEDSTLKLRVVRALKVAALRRASAVVSVSAALARRTPVPSIVIPNTYDAAAFQGGAPVERDPAGVVFLGRLVEQKGVDELIDAVALLRDRGVRVALTVVGDGDQRHALERRAQDLGIADRVRFAGTVSGPPLVDLLRRQTVMAVPSRGHEPFGITALEGLAAGCAVVVTATGGPPEAVGLCGLVVPPNDSEALADAIRSLLEDEPLRSRLAEQRERHLDSHSPAAVGAEYDRLLQRLIATS